MGTVAPWSKGISVHHERERRVTEVAKCADTVL
jgi:hypothetical protein